MPRSQAGGRTPATNRVVVQDVKASLKFDKASSTKLITPANLVTSTSAFTVAALVTINDYTQYLSLFDCGANGGFRIETSTLRKLSFTVWNGAVQGTAVSAGYTINTWFPLVATFNAGVMKLYFNGAQVATATGHTMTATASAIGIGARASGFQNLGANISNAVFYNGYAFTASDVTNYQSGILPSGATFIYPLQEGAGTTAYDSSGNGNNGTITAGSWTRDTPTKKRKVVNGNMVYNGDFEIAPVVNVPTTTVARWIDGTAAGSTTNNIFGWGVVTKTGTAEAIFDSTSPSSGTESMKVSTTATASKIQVGSNGIDTAGNNRLSCISVLPSTSYTLTFRMKTQLNSGTATGGAKVAVNTFTGAGAYVGTPVLTTAIKTTTDWTTYTSTFTTSETVRLLAAYLVVDGSGGAATLIMDAWFDDIVLTPTTPTTRSAA